MVARSDARLAGWLAVGALVATACSGAEPAVPARITLDAGGQPVVTTGPTADGDAGTPDSATAARPRPGGLALVPGLADVLAQEPVDEPTWLDTPEGTVVPVPHDARESWDLVVGDRRFTVDLDEPEPVDDPEQVVTDWLDDLEVLLAEADRTCRRVPGCAPLPEDAPDDARPLLVSVDISGSMETADVGRARSAVALDAATALIDELEAILAAPDNGLPAGLEPQLGLLTWYGIPWRSAGPTTDYAEVRGGLGQITNTGGGTDFAAAIARTVELFAGRPGTVVMLSDGEDHLESSLAAAESAAETGMVIHTVGVGAEDSEDYSEEVLTAIADATGGTFRTAADLDQLRAAFRTVLIEALSDMAVADVVAEVLAAGGGPSAGGVATLADLPEALSGSLAELAEIREAIDPLPGDDLEPLARVLQTTGMAATTRRMAVRFIGGGGSGGGAIGSGGAGGAGGADDDPVPCQGASEKITEQVLNAVAGGASPVNGWIGSMAQYGAAPFGGTIAAIGGLGPLVGNAVTAYGFGQDLGEAYLTAAGCLAEVAAQIGS